jgi:HEPN domain-containing protein
MSDPNDPLSWVERAEEDYAVARSALRRKPTFAYTACFHAQQCAEKYLKALLVAGRHPFPKVHDLLVLNDECARSGIFVDVSEDQLSSLSHYAVRVRYPGDEPTRDETRRAVEIAKSVRRFVRKWLGLGK